MGHGLHSSVSKSVTVPSGHSNKHMKGLYNSCPNNTIKCHKILNFKWMNPFKQCMTTLKVM